VGGVSYGWIPIIVGPEEEGWGRRMTDGGGGTAPPAGAGLDDGGAGDSRRGRVSHGISKGGGAVGGWAAR
jgi:hypothetical protein